MPTQFYHEYHGVLHPFCTFLNSENYGCELIRLTIFTEVFNVLFKKKVEKSVEKVPHTLENGVTGEFRITGDVPVFYLDLTRRLFPNLKEINDEDEKLINVRDSDWFKKMEANATPSLSLRALRTMRNMKQSELAKKIGVLPRQISDMEKGRAPIGKKMAMRIGKALDMDYRHFL